MSNIKRKHSKQTKLKAALELIKSEKTIAQLCQEYTVHQSVLHRWKKTLLEEGADIFDQPRKKEQISDNKADLERKVGQLTMENDFLKKALGQ